MWIPELLNYLFSPIELLSILAAEITQVLDSIIAWVRCAMFEKNPPFLSVLFTVFFRFGPDRKPLATISGIIVAAGEVRCVPHPLNTFYTLLVSSGNPTLLLL